MSELRGRGRTNKICVVDRFHTVQKRITMKIKGKVRRVWVCTLCGAVQPDKKGGYPWGK